MKLLVEHLGASPGLYDYENMVTNTSYLEVLPD